MSESSKTPMTDDELDDLYERLRDHIPAHITRDQFIFGTRIIEAFGDATEEQLDEFVRFISGGGR